MTTHCASQYLPGHNDDHSSADALLSGRNPLEGAHLQGFTNVLLRAD